MASAEERQRARFKRVMLEADRLRVNDEARRLVAEEEARRNWSAPTGKSLDVALAEELPDMEWSIEGLHAKGMNSMLVAQYKTGKTTMMVNLVKALADDDEFLGMECLAPEGNIAFWNYEMGERQILGWLEDIGIDNPERVHILNLRGVPMPLYSPLTEEWSTNWLAEHDISSWLVDPVAKAMVGWPSDGENSNTSVGEFLDTLDRIKENAGVTDLYVAHHTGRAIMEEGQERGRGATRWDDWPDVRWLLTKNKQKDRFFYAEGRDVTVEEMKLEYDEDTRALIATDGESRKQERDMEDAFAVIDALLLIGDGHTKSKVRTAIKGVAHERKLPAIDLAEQLGFVSIVCAEKGTGLHVSLNREHESVVRREGGHGREDIIWNDDEGDTQ